VRIRQKKERKVMKAVAAGALVWIVASLADIALMPIDRMLIPRMAMANLIGGLVAVVVTLAIQLRHEEVHYHVGMERAAIISELNHHVRNAVFPMHVALLRVGDAEAKKIADDAVERINVALKDATADALTGKLEYAVESDAGVPSA
jgi:hypothetical protein